MKKLGFGLMRLPLTDPNDAASIDIELTKKMADLFISRGFTYFDTAWMYCGFKCENAVKEVLTDRYPRDSFLLASKLHSNFLETAEDRDRIFNEQLRKTGAGYFDYYLLHGIGAERYVKYEQLDCFNWLLDKKAKGLVKRVGFSFHDTPEVLDRILTEHPEMEFVQLQLNYLDWDSESVQARGCYETAVRHGRQVIVMEPVKGGALANVPPAAEALLKGYAPQASVASWAVRFAASLPNVIMVLSGMNTLEQVEDNTGFMDDLQPLTERERELCFQAADIINGRIAIPCTGCAYCTEGCPMHIAIPQYFALYNERARSPEDGDAARRGAYERLTENFGRPEQCVRCGQCEGVCPQHLPVIEDLRAVAEAFGQ